MPGFFHFLRCLGRAAVKNAGKALASLVPLGEATYEIAKDTLEDYRKDHAEAFPPWRCPGLRLCCPAGL
jgi:hypothetical protein